MNSSNVISDANIIKCLESAGCFDIHTVCLNYSSNKEQVIYPFEVVVNPFSLLEINQYLFHLIIHKPFEAKKLIQKALFNFVKQKKWLKYLQNVYQLMIGFVITHLPSLPEYTIGKLQSSSLNENEARFYRYDGVVMQMSTSSSYTLCAVYLCSNKFCPEPGKCYFSVYTLGAHETATVRNDLLCRYCGHNMFEAPSCRVLGEKITTLMFGEDELNQKGSLFQAVTVYFRDELIKSIELGKRYSVIVLPVFEYSDNMKNTSFEANNLFADNSEPSNVTDYSTFLSTFPSNTTLHYMPSTKELAWKSVLSMAYKFASHIAPMGTFTRLKLGLILSLVGCPKDNDWTMPVLVVGSNTVILNRLLEYGIQLAPRSIIHNATTTLTATVTKLGPTVYRFEAGSLLLARGGVCFLGDCGRFPKLMIDSIQSVLEKSVMTVKVSQKSGDDIFKQLTCPLLCQIWAYTSPGIKTPYIIPRPLSEMFGMVYFTDNENPAQDAMLTMHTLSQAVNPNCLSEEISLSELKEILLTANAIETTFTAEAECLIQGYFVSSRRARSSHYIEFPLHATKIISLLAKSACKLGLRNGVTEHDAVLAILMYEESISERLGNILLNGIPPIQVKDQNNLDCYLEEELKRLENFHEQLEKFINTYAGEVRIKKTSEE